jgi:hypothetical protein
MISKKFLKENGIKWELTNKIEKVGYAKKIWCRCSCGYEKWVWLGNLKRLKTKCCSKCASTKHGGSYSRLHNIWRQMKYRCSKEKGHKDYGGRGIKVCKEWKKSFIVFRKWALSNGYKDNLTIERINVNGCYEPSNCTWITIQQQAHNTRRNVVIKGKNLKQWSDELLINRGTLQSRKKYRGVTEDILKPLRVESSPFPGVSYDKMASGRNWRARGGHNGKVYNIGRFKKEKEAFQAYKKWKNKFKKEKKKLIKRY